MNIKAVLRIVSPVIAAIGVAMLGSSIVSLLYHENPSPLLVGAVSALLWSGVVWLLTRTTKIDKLDVREGCAIATLSWLLACLFGALPFYTMHYVSPQLVVTFTDSFFEAVSGFTTTGASIFSDVEVLPKGILFWRSLTHWFGGMGIVVFAIAILPKLGIGGMHGFRMESPGPLKSDKLVPRISETGRILYTVYLAVTIIMVVVMLLAGVNLFDTLIHTFGTVGTGGFSNYNASVAGLHNPAAEWIIAFFMWVCGVNFGLTYVLLWQGDWRSVWKDVEFKVYTSVVGLAIAITASVLLFNNFGGWAPIEALRYATFQVLTIVSTSGFATYNYDLWPPAALSMLILMMFMGASTGSTGGGMKVLRHIINVKFLTVELKKIVRPHLVETVKIGDRALPPTIVSSAVALTIIYFSTFFIGGLALMLLGYEPVLAFSAAIATLGNIGPGLHEVGPVGNYSNLSAAAIWLLSALMLIGRLEVYTIFALFVPWVWRK